jgi:four helix bundle protein
MSFSFENLDVYKKSIAFVGRIEVLIGELKGKISYPILDQLTRAALSIPLNIAEGNGRWHKNEKRQFFWIARGSAFEVVPILEVIRNKGCLADEKYDELYQNLVDIGKMITNLIKSVEKLDQASYPKDTATNEIRIGN